MKEIEKLKRKLQDRNKELVKRSPKIQHEFDWSSDAYEYSHNEGFIRELNQILK